MTGLDTNGLVRYLTQDDARQSRRVNALVAEAVAAGERLFVGAVVLCELVWVLRGAYGFDKPTVADAIEKVIEAGAFSIEGRDVLGEALTAYRTGRGDFADYVLGLRNREAGCRTTVTFDRALRRGSLFTIA